MQRWAGPLALGLLLLTGVQSESLGTGNWSLGEQPPINYTKPDTSQIEYAASNEHQIPEYMQLFNEFVGKVVDLLLDRQAVPEGLLSVENATLKVNPTTNSLLRHYGVLGGVSAGILVLALLLPCLSLCFSCAASGDPYGRRRLRSRKRLASLGLTLLCALLVLGVFFSCSSNLDAEQGKLDLLESLDASLYDLQLYFSTVNTEVSTLFGRNFLELTDGIQSVLVSCGELVLGKLAELSKAVSLINLDNIVSGLEDITEDLETIKETTSYLKSNASELVKKLNQIKGSAIDTLTTCGLPQCEQMMEESKIKEIDTTGFENLPENEVTEALKTVSELLNDNIVEEVRKGKELFDNIQKQIQDSVDEMIPELQKNMRGVGDKLNETVEKVSNFINRTVNDHLEQGAMFAINDFMPYIDQYSTYRYYASLATSGVLLIIVAFLFLGVLCGLCDKRPGDYDKGCGPCFLKIAICLILPVTSVLMIIIVPQMIGGVLSERVICEPLKRPDGNRLIQLVDKFLEIEDDSMGFRFPNLTVEHIASSCHRNEPLGKILKLEEVYDIEKMWQNYTKQFDIDGEIKKIIDKINLSSGRKFISDQAREKLDELINSGLDDIDFDKYTKLLEEKITTVSLEQLASILRMFANEMLPSSHQTTRSELLRNAEELENCQRNYIIPMTNSCQQLGETSRELEKDIKFNHTSMADAVKQTVKQVEDVEKWVNNEGPKLIKTLANELGEIIFLRIDEYVQHVENIVYNDFARCGPVSNVYNVTIVAGCDKILNPLNGFWISIGWCLILMILVIILARKLRSLQEKANLDTQVFGKLEDEAQRPRPQIIFVSQKRGTRR